MDDGSGTTSPVAARFRTARIIAFAYVISLVLYAFLIYLMLRGEAPPERQPVPDVLRYMLYAAAVLVQFVCPLVLTSWKGPGLEPGGSKDVWLVLRAGARTAARVLDRLRRCSWILHSLDEPVVQESRG